MAIFSLPFAAHSSGYIIFFCQRGVAVSDHCLYLNRAPHIIIFGINRRVKEMKIVIVLLAAVIGLAMSNELLQATSEEVWWEAPSRRAPFYAHKYRGLQERLKRAATRQGEEMRLPRDLLPSTYKIRLLPFIEEGNFTTHGYIEIVIDCKIATSNILLNAAELDIDTSSIQVCYVFSLQVPQFLTN